MLAGDFNVIPAAPDVHNPAALTNDALFRPTTRESFQSLLGLGLTDALRAVTDAPGPVHVLGLSGWGVAKEPRLAH